MRLRGDKLEALAGKSGVTLEQLAEAVERTGLQGDRALSAVKNWIGRLTPPRFAGSLAEFLIASG